MHKYETTHPSFGRPYAAALLRTDLLKVRRSQSGLPTKRRREMTAAGKSQSKRDLFDRQFRLIDQQVARPVQPPVHHVAMRRRSCTLAECTFEVTGADPGKRSQLAQSDRLTERVLNVFENESEAATWKAAPRSRWSLGQVGIAVNQMMGEEFAATLCVEPSCRRAIGGFACEIQCYCFDDGISNQELLVDLNFAGVRSPVFIDWREMNSGRITTTAAREDALASQVPSTPGGVRLIVPRIAPALDHVVADLASDLVTSRQIDPECQIAKTNPRLQRRVVDDPQQKWIPASHSVGDTPSTSVKSADFGGARFINQIHGCCVRDRRSLRSSSTLP